MFSTRFASLRTVATRGVRSMTQKAAGGKGDTSIKISDRAIIDRLAAPGTGKNRKVPKEASIDWLNAAEKKVKFSAN